MCAKYQKYAIALIASIFILSIISSITLQPVKAGIPNGNIITSVTGTYGVGGNICFDGAYYYVFYESANNLYYAYATNPLGTWNTKTISSGGGSYIWSVSCGQNTTPTLIAYAVGYCTCNITIYVSSIQGDNIISTIHPSVIHSGITNTMVSLSILDNFYAYGGVAGQLPYPVDANLWILFEYETTYLGSCGVTELKIGATYPPSKLIGNVSMAASSLAIAGNCDTFPGYIYDNKGLPAVVYNCEAACTSLTYEIRETQIDRIINQTTYYWTTPVSTPITKDSTGQTIYYNYAFASTMYNGNILAIGDCYFSTIYSYPCNGFNVIDYWSFNMLDQNWTEISSNIEGTLSARSLLLLNTDSNTGITRVYYYNSSSIQYFYPVNETGSTVHIGYLSSGNTMNGITVNQYSQAQNYYYAYTVSSTSPALLEWASYTTQPSSVTTVTAVVYSTVIVSPALSKCTNTNSCVTNQFSSFLTILLPSIIITALMLYFPYKMGIKDERVYVFIFMMIISGIGFLSAGGAFGNNGIPWYIPIFVDIIGFMLIISFRNNNSGDSM